MSLEEAPRSAVAEFGCGRVVMALLAAPAIPPVGLVLWSIVSGESPWPQPAELTDVFVGPLLLQYAGAGVTAGLVAFILHIFKTPVHVLSVVGLAGLVGAGVAAAPNLLLGAFPSALDAVRFGAVDAFVASALFCILAGVPWRRRD